jgi:hypothetical protein
MTRISHPMTIVDLAGSPSLEIQIGREYVGQAFMDSAEGCWVASLDDLHDLRRLLFSVLRRFQFRRPNERVKPGYKYWSVGTDEQFFNIGVGVVACEDGDYAVFEFNRRFYISLDQVQELFKTVNELIKAINAEQRHVERREPGPRPSFIDQWSAGIDKKYGGDF